MVVFIAAGILALGLFLRVPARMIWLMLAVLWLAVMVAVVLLPEQSPLARSIGGSWQSWAVLGGGALLVLAYRRGLRALRARARPLPAPVGPQATFREAELERYARHIVLREIGGPGQKRLKAARVLVVGAGGLGSPVLLYLAAAGVGTIAVVDNDIVSNSNLQRQIIHTDARIGMPKVFSAEMAMRALNPFIEVHPYARRLTEAVADELFAQYDIILDGSDNFETRYMVNRAAVRARKPLISGAIAQWEGQIGLYDPSAGGPCFECVFPSAPAAGLAPSCAQAGVVGALPGVVGAMMAVETIKHIAAAGQSLRGRLVLYDALWGESRQISVSRRADCACCAQR
jgi:molybdopterin/thiamine biosynthesis adenylyltransferase